MSNATTGSDRVAPDQPPPEAEQGSERGSRLTRLTRPAVTHWQFAVVMAAAVVVRLYVILVYPPILWFNDSYNYIYDAVTHVPDRVRPNGYPFFLDLLMPLHSAYPLAVLQAAMGVAMGVAIYALLRHRGLPWWGAILPTLPVLFDSYELHLEHMVTADTLFIFLATVAVVILCWNDRPSVPVMAVAGLLIGYATLVRSVGQPLLVVVLVAMLARRAGWRRLVTLVVAGVVPIAAYMFWFHSTYGNYTLTGSSGTFLYSRVSTFAECSKMHPPAEIRPLCDPTPTSLRPASGEYIWSNNELPPLNRVTTPLFNLHNSSDIPTRFSPHVNKIAGSSPGTRSCPSRTTTCAWSWPIPCTRSAGTGSPTRITTTGTARSSSSGSTHRRCRGGLVPPARRSTRRGTGSTARTSRLRSCTRPGRSSAGPASGIPASCGPGSGTCRSTSGTSTCAGRCSA